MMRWRALFSTGDRLEHVEGLLLEMLRLNRHGFELAHQALFVEGDGQQLRGQVYDTDHQVHQLVQQVRRELLVHATVHETSADIPAMFTYLSMIKDIERIGDNVKNILDIAVARTDWPDATELGDVATHRDATTRLFDRVIPVFGDRDTDAANRLLRQISPDLAELDLRIDELVVSDRPAPDAVPRALYYRHLQRIASHLMTVLTSLAAPMDQLDFYRPP